jgi:hypothetical protein
MGLKAWQANFKLNVTVAAAGGGGDRHWHRDGPAAARPAGAAGSG